MKTHALALALLAALSTPAFAIGNAFTYQGSLTDATLPATGTYDLQFTLQTIGGAAIGSPLTKDDVLVSAGLFSVELDFGPVIASGDYQLQIGVRPGASGGTFTSLTPATRITPTPQASIAAVAQSAITVSNSAIGTAQINSSQVQTRVSGTCGPGFSINAIASNGTVTCEADDTGGSGDITSVTTAPSSGLNGGAISGDASLSIAIDGVNSARIANGSVGSLDINSNEVQRRISSPCAAGQTVQSVSDLGIPTCIAPTLQTFELTIPSVTAASTRAQNCQNNSSGVSQLIDGNTVELPAGTYMVTMPLIASITIDVGPINNVLLPSLGFIDTNLKRVGGGLGSFATARLASGGGPYVITDSHTRIFSLAQPTSMFVQVEAKAFYCGQVQGTGGRQLAILKIQ